MRFELPRCFIHFFYRKMSFEERACFKSLHYAGESLWWALDEQHYFYWYPLWFIRAAGFS